MQFLLANSPTISLQPFYDTSKCNPLTPQVIKILLARDFST